MQGSGMTPQQLRDLSRLTRRGEYENVLADETSLKRQHGASPISTLINGHTSVVMPLHASVSRKATNSHCAALDIVVQGAKHNPDKTTWLSCQEVLGNH
ncbi:hypothetical protein TNCV_1395681 [Trichonephila clavipes]|nr:hypothetical protein TNCV_1395681 [Trichonephila clavipes]